MLSPLFQVQSILFFILLVVVVIRIEKIFSFSSLPTTTATSTRIIGKYKNSISFIHSAEYYSPSTSYSSSWRRREKTSTNSLLLLAAIYNNNKKEYSRSNVYDDDGVDDDDIDIIEREIKESVQSKLDWKLFREKVLLGGNRRNGGQHKKDSLSPSSGGQIGISIASGSTCAILTYLATNGNYILTGMVFVIVSILANRDPLDEEVNDVDGSGSAALGATARIIGRTTLKSIEATTPKVRAVARAVVDGDDEIINLKEQIIKLQEENLFLKHELNQRQLVDDLLPNYNLIELKDLARKNELIVGGTKSQILLRLIQAGVME